MIPGAAAARTAPRQGSGPAVTAGSATIETARTIAARWVAAFVADSPGFRGALLHGSACYLDAGARLPAESDIDVITLWDGTPPALIKTVFDGIILDVCAVSVHELTDPQRILRDHVFAGSFARGLVVADPTATVGPVAAIVGREFREPPWVRARVEHALARAEQILAGVADDLDGPDAVAGVLFGPGVLVHALLVAACRNPTVRRRYEAADELLRLLALDGEHARLLQLLGSHRLTQPACRAHFAAMQAAYDAAVLVPNPPARYANHVSPAARRCAIEGTARSLRDGHHREAMFFVGTCFSKAMAILEPVAASQQTAAHAAVHAAGYAALLDDLGIATVAARSRRIALARAAVPWIRALADRIISVSS